MKQVFTVYINLLDMIPTESFAYGSKLRGFILENELPRRVYKSQIKSDSVVLAQQSKWVNPNDPEIQEIISKMYRTVTDSLSLGVGIAAPQIYKSSTKNKVVPSFFDAAVVGGT